MDKDKTREVVLTASSRWSKHTYVLAELLDRSGISVTGIIAVSPFDFTRIRRYIHRFGVKRALERQVPRLLGISNHRKGEKHSPFGSFLEEKDIEPGSLSKWAKRNRAKFVSVQSVNSNTAVSTLAQLSPDWVIYGGGGILKEQFIKTVDGRILNAHSGPLPEVRGMNACEWSLILGFEPTVTIHLINQGIDTGGVIESYDVPVDSEDTIESLREKCIVIGVDGLHRAILDPPRKLPEPSKSAAIYRQCFEISPMFREMLELYLNN